MIEVSLAMGCEYKNCYNCSYYHYLNESDFKSYCTDNSICPMNYNKLIENKRECISSCEKDINYNKAYFSLIN